MRSLVVIACLLLCVVPVLAEDDPDCASCRSEDEHQVGDYAEPIIPQPQKPTPTDSRGTAYQLPIPGAPVIHHRAGAGVWVGAVGEGNNVFVQPKRDQLSVGVKRDF